MLVLARAKLNLTLDVIGRRPDGYHEIESVVQSIDVCDDVAVGSTAARPVMHDGSEIGVVLNCENALVPPGQENLAVRAAMTLARSCGVSASIWIDLKKKIPVAAGLGGGSADAAAVLAALNEMWGLGMDAPALAQIGASIGSDVPFCVTGGTAVIRGRGERVEPLPSLEGLWFVVVVPSTRVSSAEAYAAFDEESRDDAGTSAARATRATPEMIEAVASHDIARVAALFANDLEPVSSAMVPDMAEAKRALLAAGALGAGMSGSGPAVFGMAPDEQTARQIRRQLRKRFEAAFVCRSTGKGLERVELRSRGLRG